MLGLIVFSFKLLEYTDQKIDQKMRERRKRKRRESNISANPNNTASHAPKLPRYSPPANSVDFYYNNNNRYNIFNQFAHPTLLNASSETDRNYVPPPSYLKIGDYIGDREYGNFLYTKIPTNIKNIRIYYDTSIECIIFTSRSNETFRFGYLKPVDHVVTIKFQPNEKIESINFRFDKFLKQIQFKTNLKVTKFVGNPRSKLLTKSNSNIHNIDFKDDEYRSLYGMRGRHCMHISGIQFISSL